MCRRMHSAAAASLRLLATRRGLLLLLAFVEAPFLGLFNSLAPALTVRVCRAPRMTISGLLARHAPAFFETRRRLFTRRSPGSISLSFSLRARPCSFLSKVFLAACMISSGVLKAHAVLLRQALRRSERSAPLAFKRALSGELQQVMKPPPLIFGKAARNCPSPSGISQKKNILIDAALFGDPAAV